VNVRAVVLAAACIAATSPALAQQATSPALIDRDFTVGAGATISATLGEAGARAEDAVVPHRLFQEQGALRRGGNISYRLLKYAFFDAPQESLLMVFNHEVFGHGARLRERFDGPIGYHFQAPSPYGRGGAYTAFVFDREPAPYEQLAVHGGGMEASSVAAALTADHALTQGTWRPRDAIRYLTFELDTLSYVLSTDEAEEPGQDVADFLHAYNDMAAAVGASPLTTRTLRREALVGLANPMLAYSVYGIARYVWDGSTNMPVPMASIAGVRYLPMFRYRLAPYGTEWSLVNELGGRVRPMQIELRVGRAPSATPWGIRVRQRQIALWRGWRADGAVDVWRQPPLANSGFDLSKTDTRIGGEFRARFERALSPVSSSVHRPTLVIDAGIKTSGFVAGEPLRGGLVLRAGVGLPLGAYGHGN
jgi:hypothetical protein